MMGESDTKSIQKEPNLIRHFLLMKKSKFNTSEDIEH